MLKKAVSIILIRRIILTMLCLIGTLSLITEAQVRRGNGAQKSTSASSSQDEGQREATKFWSKYVASCGGSHYIRKAPSIFVELRGFHITMNYEPITEADRLNGIQAKGSSRFTASAHRFYSNSAWHQWSDSVPEDMNLVNSVRFQKTRGRWTYNGVGYFNDYAKTVTCSDVPGFRRAAANEIPTNTIQINDTHVFPIESLTFWESSSKENGNRFSQSSTTSVNWKIIYTETAFEYTPPPVESYWYKDGVQWSYAGVAKFSNSGKGQLWDGKGWAEPGHWQTGKYTVKIYVRKQLAVIGSFEIIADEQLPHQLRYDGVYTVDDYNHTHSLWLRFYDSGAVVYLMIPKTAGDPLNLAPTCLTTQHGVYRDGCDDWRDIGTYTINASNIEIRLKAGGNASGTIGHNKLTMNWANTSPFRFIQMRLWV
jgi:hypothetical protein